MALGLTASQKKSGKASAVSKHRKNKSQGEGNYLLKLD